jgi:antirestriction protein ArdC
MARYFFNLHECGTVSDDPEGMERADLDHVRQEALRAAREVMCAEVNEGRLCLSCHIEVKDEDGAVVLLLPFAEALTITGL